MIKHPTNEADKMTGPPAFPKSYISSSLNLAAIVESSDDAIVSKDLNGIILSWNKGAERIFGYSAEEMIGKPVTLLMPEGRRNEESNILAKIKQGERVDHYETIRQRKDGSLVNISLTVSPIKDETGQIIGASKIARDITPQKRVEELELRFAAIVESSDDAILSKDLNGTILSWNRAAEKIFGYSGPEVIGRSVTVLIPPDQANEEPEILAKIRRGEKVDHYQTVRKRKDGKLVNISLTVSPVRNAAGVIVGASKIARDITDQKRGEKAELAAKAELADRALQLEQAVAQRTAQLTAANNQLEAFIYTIAHDLRAPLRSMEGFSDMLLREEGEGLSELGRDFAGRINRSARFMDQLLADLLAFSRMSQEHIELKPVPLEPVIQAALARVEKEIQDKAARVECSGPWPPVLAQGTILGQIVFNLLSNALKFIEPGRPPLVRLRAEERGAFIRLWVEDNGIGIAPENQEQIFRLFVRLDRDKFPGTGTGLAIVQKGAERMKGRVGVESVPGQGSRFWVELQKA